MHPQPYGPAFDLGYLQPTPPQGALVVKAVTPLRLMLLKLLHQGVTDVSWLPFGSSTCPMQLEDTNKQKKKD